MPQLAQSSVDPEFWERLRELLKAHIDSKQLKQKELAGKLGIDATTLNNFLNRQSKTLGGMAVALACTVVDMECNGTRIGRVIQRRHAGTLPDRSDEQLVLEFDAAFEVRGETKQPTIVLRKKARRENGLRLAIRRIG